MSKINSLIVTDIAKEIGFDLVGFAKAEILSDETLLLESWLKNNFHANMSYLSNNLEKRRDVSKILPDVKNVISLGLNYYKDEDYGQITKKTGKVSRYAWGIDYHLVIKGMLKEFENRLKKLEPNFSSVSYVDTGPVMDKVWAVKSGLGWMGKHTNVINNKIGSWFFIANILCNQEFEYSLQIQDLCGSCNACIDACPTNAIVVPYVIDSNLCISYQTIENKEDIPLELKNKFDNWAFGCDICQDVCPWNKKFSTQTNKNEFEPENKYLSYDEISQMNEEQFNQKFKNSPIKRSKLKGIKRNLNHIMQID